MNFLTELVFGVEIDLCGETDLTVFDGKSDIEARFLLISDSRKIKNIRKMGFEINGEENRFLLF